jgi:hypothetical protein
VSQAAYGSKVMPPMPLLEALWCERYRCLPSELEDEDANAMLLHGQLLTLYRAMLRQQAGQKLTPGEDELVGKVLQMELEADG